MEKNIVGLGRPQMTIWRMRIACWIPKATDIPSEYVILIAFPLQQWSHERASMLRYTYIACLSSFFIIIIHIAYCWSDTSKTAEMGAIVHGTCTPTREK